jgi:hypothetical protein
MKKTKIEICCGGPYDKCNSAAVWVRHTQFAGSHFFCDKHARAEKDFCVNDSYQDWENLIGK